MRKLAIGIGIAAAAIVGGVVGATHTDSPRIASMTDYFDGRIDTCAELEPHDVADLTIPVCYIVPAGYEMFEDGSLGPVRRGQSAASVGDGWTSLFEYVWPSSWDK